MGVIKNRSTGQHVLLNYEHVFGRSETQAKTVIKGGEISRSHATIRWKGHKWIIQDHSLNGTLVNQKLNKQSSSDLKEGDEIKFGLIDGGVWEIVNDDPPISFLQNTTIPEEVFALASRPGIATPDYEGVSFFLGRDSRWKAELAGMVIDLLDGGKIKLGETELVFIENDGFTTTINMGEQTSRARFIFLLSPDEERISVEIQENDWKMDMGERVHNYLLLVLARKLFEDIDQGLHYRDRGWIGMELVTEDMSKEFRKSVDEYQVNLQIYRLRKQLLNLTPYGYLFTNVIERRKGELRFAHSYLEIRKEGKIVKAALPE